MDRNRQTKKEQILRRLWLCRSHSRPRLGQILLFICLASVGLNVFLLFFRNASKTQSKRYSAIQLPNIVYDSWAAGLEGVTLPKLILETKEGKNKSPNIAKRGTNTHGLPLVIKTSGSSKPVKVKDRQKPKAMNIVTPVNETMSLCPLNPPGLRSLRALTDDVTHEQLCSLFPEMEKGGRIRPKRCTPRERLAVIIPFRNRHKHLHILLRNLIPFLQRQMADATIFIIEQAPPSTFNRGALLNVGFLEAQKIADFDCFMLHDVDLIPLNERNLYRCGNNPRHHAAAINKHRYKLAYETYFGGVVGFSKEQYIKVNGNSNLYFGWGGEDDDLGLRIVNKNYIMDRYDAQTSRYLMIKHTRDTGNAKNIERRKLMNSALTRQDVEGLNTTKYKVNSVEVDLLYTWINVSLDLKEIIETAPNNTRREIWKLLRDVKQGKIHR